MNGTLGMYVYVYKCGECNAYGTNRCPWLNVKEDAIACERFEHNTPTISTTGTTPICEFGLDLPNTMASYCGPIINERRRGMITEDYVSLEIARLLKDNGYGDAPTSYLKTGDDMFPTCLLKNKEHYPAPTHHLAMKWLREVHDIFIAIMIFDEEDRIGLNEDERYCWNIHYNSTGNIRPFDGTAKTPEEACEAAIKYCLENLI